MTVHKLKDKLLTSIFAKNFHLKEQIPTAPSLKRGEKNPKFYWKATRSLSEARYRNGRWASGECGTRNWEAVKTRGPCSCCVCASLSLGHFGLSSLSLHSSVLVLLPSPSSLCPKVKESVVTHVV